MIQGHEENGRPTDLGKEVIGFYEFVGFDPKDKTVIGNVNFKRAKNTIRDIPRFLNQKDKYICIHPLKLRKLKANVTRVFTCFVDFDFGNYDLALAHIEKVKSILNRHGFYYGIVHSGRGLHLYLPVGDVGKPDIVQLNIYLNRIILEEYYENGIIDRKLVKNYSTFLRLPETINSKNGKRTFIAFQNFEEATNDSIDYFRHNHEIMLNGIVAHESAPSLTKPNFEEFHEIDYRHSFFRWDFFEYIISGGAKYVVLEEMVKAFRAKDKDRELNSYLFSNLAIYIKKRSPHEADVKKYIQNATKFIEKISDDPDDPVNLQRWLDRYDETLGTDEEMGFRSKAMLNWAARKFPNTIVHKLIKDDSDRLYRHNAYFTFIEENMNGHSVEEMRAKWNDFVGQNMDKAGFHWGVLETGIGKTDQFLRLAKEGKKVTVIVPYLMLKFDIEREIGRGSVFTIDSVRGGDRVHKMRQNLFLQLMDADIVVVDESHCLDLHYTLKPDIMDEFDDTIRRVALQKPVFMLTGTPSVNQIITLSDPNTSKIVSYLRKDLKKISVKVIDKEGLQGALRDHERILIYIDDKRQIDVLKEYIETHLTSEHTIFPLHSKISTIRKKRTEEEIRETEKWIIIGTSSVVSGINIDGLQSIVFSNRIINQQNLYQCMGRLRIVNRLDTVHPIYIINMTDFRNPKADLDMFEFVSPASIIKYLSKLYHISDKISCGSKICSFTRLKNFEDWKKLIRSVPDIKSYYALDQVQLQNLYWIPKQIIRELNGEGFFREHPDWLNVPVKSILYMKSGESSDHRAIIEIRNKDMGITNSIWHYFDPVELRHVRDYLSSIGKPMELPKAVLSIIQ